MAGYPPVVVIAGPTAIGKSRLALELSPVVGAEIVTADSRQVYRYMDIGTAKPAPAEQAAVSHHMIDLVQPDDVYSAQRYREEGLRVLRAIAGRGRPAFVVGGTGFYLRALLDGLSAPPVAPHPAYRQLLRQEAEVHGSAALHARLAALDPASAARIQPNNLPRVIRALEIVHHLGGPVPALPETARIPALYLGLTMDRARLRAVADRRVVAQVRAGLVEETRRLLEMGYSRECPSMSGFAYRQMVAYLSSEMSLAEAIASYQAATRQYIRRQMTWFRRDTRLEWLDAGDFPALVSDARARIKAWLG